MNTTISIAGLNIGLEYTHDYVLRQCRRFLTDAAPDFTVSSTPDDWAAERIVAEADNQRVSDGSAEFVCLYREIAKRLPEYDAFLMHGAAMYTYGKGYLFTAPSGTGKTTHTRMWKQRYPDAVGYINGDKPIIRKIDGVFCFCGTPWRGKEKYGKPIIVPANGNCLLERSEENRIQRVQPTEVFAQMTHQVFFPKDPIRLNRFLTLFDEYLSTVPIYRMGCNMDISAAEMSYAAMTGKTV